MSESLPSDHDVDPIACSIQSIECLPSLKMSRWRCHYNLRRVGSQLCIPQCIDQKTIKSNFTANFTNFYNKNSLNFLYYSKLLYWHAYKTHFVDMCGYWLLKRILLSAFRTFNYIHSNDGVGRFSYMKNTSRLHEVFITSHSRRDLYMRDLRVRTQQSE